MVDSGRQAAGGQSRWEEAQRWSATTLSPLQTAARRAPSPLGVFQVPSAGCRLGRGRRASVDSVRDEATGSAPREVCRFLRVDMLGAFSHSLPPNVDARQPFSVSPPPPTPLSPCRCLRP